MCGIAGVAAFGAAAPDARRLAERMSARLRHRGPDGAGVYEAQAGGLTVALAARRLAIIDLSDAGRMPMANEDGRVHIAYNGEVYNHLALRQALEARGHVYRSLTDTETVLHAYEEYGLDAFRRLNGIFALALHDRRSNRLVLARDRRGVKPLYYAWDGSRLVFASELKALLQWAELPREVDRTALDLYLALGFVPSPHTLLRGVRKLPPACVAVLDHAGLRIEPFWVDRVRAPGAAARLDDASLRGSVRRAVEAAVERQLMSDVPMGVLLSGGVDSTIIASLAQRRSQSPLSTFSVGFRDLGSGTLDALNTDLQLARRTAAALGTTHHEILLENSPALADRVRRAVEAMDDPSHDPTVVASDAICELARANGVKVVLAGDAGDELFGGYPHYVTARRLALYRRVPNLASAVRRLGPALPLLPRLVQDRAADFLATHDLSPEQVYLSFNGLFDASARAALLGDSDPSAAAEVVRARLRPAENAPLADQIAYGDLALWVDEHFNPRLDRMSMRNSVEARVPLQDDDLVDLALTIPIERKLRWAHTKSLLREAFWDVLPPAVRRLRKRSFMTPRDAWLRGGLRSFVDETLTRETVERAGLVAWEPVERLIGAVRRGGASPFGSALAPQVWSVLILTLWAETYLRVGADGSGDAAAAG
jgi:asparagine synthase (glutamine-hydrolysing)